MLHESIKCKEKYHENEVVQYYCQDCNVCICQKCSILIHTQHAMVDIQQAVEEQKMEMKQVFARVKERMAIVNKQIIEQTELMSKSEKDICAVEKEVTEISEQIIRIAREHETAANCDTFPSHAVYHEDKFFVSYVMANCVKVFNKRGELQYDIGREGSGDVQLNHPVGLTIDRCNNLIVCDTGKSRLLVFSLDGTLVNSFSEGMDYPRFVAVTKDSKLLISDFRKHVIRVFQ